jgi:hypothetical protein
MTTGNNVFPHGPRACSVLMTSLTFSPDVLYAATTSSPRSLRTTSLTTLRISIDSPGPPHQPW